MLPVQRELAALKFIDGLSAHLKDVREPHKALRHALRDTREFFRATHGCIATLRAGPLGSRPPLHAAKADRLGPGRADALHPSHPSAGSARHVDRIGQAARRRLGRDCAGRSGPGFRSRGSTPDRAHRRGPVSRRSSDRPRSAPWRARSDRPEDHGADPSQGSLLPDPGRHPIADALRSFVGAAHPRGGRGVAARGGGTDRVDEGQERADRPADSDHGGRRGAAAVGTGVRLRSPRRQLAGVERSAGRRACGVARLQQRATAPKARTFGRRRCCVRRW